MLKSFLLAVAIAFLAVAPQTAHAEAPEAFAQRNADALIAALDNFQNFGAGDLEALRDPLAAVLDEFIDIDQVSRSIMERAYVEATSYQRSRVIQALRNSLLDTYSQAFTDLDTSSISITVGQGKSRSRVSPSGRRTWLALVPIQLESASGSSTLQYGLLSRDGEKWQMVAVTFNGMDVVREYRNDLQDLILEHNDMKVAIESWLDQLETKPDSTTTS